MNGTEQSREWSSDDGGSFEEAAQVPHAAGEYEAAARGHEAAFSASRCAPGRRRSGRHAPCPRAHLRTGPKRRTRLTRRDEDVLVLIGDG